MERLLEGYDGCTEYDVGDVPKIVVDTTMPGELKELCSAVLDFIASHAGDSLDHRHHHQSSKQVPPRVT